MFRVLVVFAVPWRQHQRDLAVGEIIVGILEGFFFFLEFKDFGIELRQMRRLHGADGDMFDGAVPFPTVFFPNAAQTGHVALGQIAIAIMCIGFYKSIEAGCWPDCREVLN